ncbi:protein KINESIN LIGHT CHAIN-RELATED 2-like [Typha latifolia]|uniref:protein KINESIN LIGHT CHAIN-RELATED 2-like n=1 Tax=Typha latifolia TaxID=4733 RepID=UPI003C2F05D1
MPGIMMDGDGIEPASDEILITSRSPGASPSPRDSPNKTLDVPVEVPVEPSIEQLYDNLRDMKSSSNGSPSRKSFESYVAESRIDSELGHLAGGEMAAVQLMEEEEEEEVESVTDMVIMKIENGSADKHHEVPAQSQSPDLSSNSSKKPKRPSRLQLKSDASKKLSLKEKRSPGKGETTAKVPSSRAGHGQKQKNYPVGEGNLQNGTEDPAEAELDNPDLGPSLLKRARDLIASNNPRRAIKFALRAAKSFEQCGDGIPSLDLIMSLHVVAATYCNLGQYSNAIPVLQRSVEIPVIEEGEKHALAKFSGYMQLGDTYAMLGQLGSALQCYTTGLQIQKQALGDVDPRVGETCRYIAEVHVQALQFDEAQRLCQMALDIHKENGELSSLEEAADRRLMGLIRDSKGDHEAALEHLVLASMAMVANGEDTEVASLDCSIGDIYLSLARYDEAVCAYKKALTVFKTSKGENHPNVASVFVRLADLYNKTGKLKESKSYCENALRIYGKPILGSSSEDIAAGLTDISAIYESMNEHEQALKLLQKALKMYNNSAGQQSTIAGIEAQIGVLYYILENYADSYVFFKNAISKLRACGEKKSAFFGIALNQMGLACVQRCAINEAADHFKEARSILEQEYGPCHPDTLGVYSNLAGTYDAMGRLDEAIEILEYVVGMREEKLGTAGPDVDDEKRRLADLLREAGRARSRKTRSLATLLEVNPHITQEDAADA